MLLSGLEWLLKIFGSKISIINKAFGNLCYDHEMSIYKENYQIYCLIDSINLSEQK